MRNYFRGFTLVETMVASAIMVIFIMSAALIVQTGIQAIGNAKLRAEATRIAQERLEQVRNLSYEDVGTVGGIPPGQLLAHEIVTINGVNFTVDTTVLFVDDAYDGKAPTDLLPVDYKRIRVSVAWSGLFSSKEPLILLTDVSPRGVETAMNAGTLSILVFDSQGIPVTGAAVHIEAAVTPAVNMDVSTDDNGMVIIPGAPICSGCYKITATKNGYTTDRTYGTDEVATPTNPHVTILNGLVSHVSFAIDIPATITVKVTHDKSMSYSPFMGVQFILKGTKEIGRDTLDDPVYKVNRTITSSTGGLASVSDLEWDTYSISLPPASSVDLAGCWPFMPISVLPATTSNVTIVSKANSAHSLLVQLSNELQQPISLAAIELSRIGEIATESTGVSPNGDWSQAFFSNLSVSNYNIKITADGYATISGTVGINGDIKESYKLSTSSGSP